MFRGKLQSLHPVGEGADLWMCFMTSPYQDHLQDEDFAEIRRLLDELPSDKCAEFADLLCLSVISKLGQEQYLSNIFNDQKDKATIQAKIDHALTIARGEGYTLTGHGISRNLASRYSDASMARVFEVIAQFCDVLKREIGVCAFVTSGTLLGLVRDQRVIPHDDDFDLAYVSAYSDKPDILRERREIFECINGRGKISIRNNGGHFGVFSRANNVDAYFDLFTGWISDGFFNEDPLDPNVIRPEDILPLQKRVFYGVEVNLPAYPEALLKVNYGPGWRSPDPSFRFDFGKNGNFYFFLQKDAQDGFYDR